MVFDSIFVSWLRARSCKYTLLPVHATLIFIYNFFVIGTYQLFLMQYFMSCLVDALFIVADEIDLEKTLTPNKSNGKQFL